MTMVRQTPLYSCHQALGAHMTPFAGFAMPMRYRGIVHEHNAVRRAAGLFDVSHMGQIFVQGPHALSFVQHIITNDAARLADCQALYTLMCTEQGGILDDLLVYRLQNEAWILVVNAANTATDLAWMQAHNPMKAELFDASDLIALIALQGPHSTQILQKITDLPIADLPSFHFVRPAPGSFVGCEKAILSKTGYTGEVGYEIYCEKESATRVWEAVRVAGTGLGLEPAGLGARDTLRLEAGYCLHGQDITTNTNPYEARLGWTVKLDKGPFIGRDALVQIRSRGTNSTLMGLLALQRGIPRRGQAVMSDSGQKVGIITSGGHSPTLGKGIALAYLEDGMAQPGTELVVAGRSALAVRVVRPPFDQT